MINCCKKILLLLWMLLGGISYSPPLVASPMNLSKELFTLLDLCEIEHDGSLPSIVKATQAAWIRKPGLERWQMKEKDFGPEKNAAIRDVIERMGFVQAVAPQNTHYRYCLLLGATLPSFARRVHYAAALWKQGIRFDQVVILTGDRPLDPIADGIPWQHKCQNESQGVEFIYHHMELPHDLHALPLFVVDTPKQPSAKGLKRPTTGDTLRAWLNHKPLPGTCLVISDQPHVFYQDSVVRSILGDTYPCSTCGPGTKIENNSLAVLLDAIARFLYQELDNTGNNTGL